MRNTCKLIQQKYSHIGIPRGSNARFSASVFNLGSLALWTMGFENPHWPSCRDLLQVKTRHDTAATRGQNHMFYICLPFSMYFYPIKRVAQSYWQTYTQALVPHVCKIQSTCRQDPSCRSAGAKLARATDQRGYKCMKKQQMDKIGQRTTTHKQHAHVIYQMYVNSPH